MDDLGQLLTQRRPALPTRAALLVIDVQNDFISPSGKMPVTLPPGFSETLRVMVPALRRAGNLIVWTRTEFQGPRRANEADADGDCVIVDKQTSDSEVAQIEEDSEDELLRAALSKPSPVTSRYPSAARTRDILKRISMQRVENHRATAKSKPAADELYLSGSRVGNAQCCLPGSTGADSPLQNELLVQEKDLRIVKSHYSAFNSTDLITVLRSRLVTELYLCGCTTNVSIYATAIDAAQHGLKVSLIKDALGYQSLASHDEALRRMTEDIDAVVTNAAQLVKPRGGTHLGHLAAQDREDVATLKLALENMTLERRVPTADIATRDLSSRARSTYNKADLRNKPTKIPTPTKSAKHSMSMERRSSDSSSTKLAATSPMPSPRVPSPAMISTQSVDEPESPISLTPTTSKKPSRLPLKAPVLGPGDKIGEGDSRIICNVGFPLAQDLSISSLSENETSLDIFARIKNEVKWQKMYHATGEVPRLVSVQGEFGNDGSMPVYRHPSDQSLPLLHFSSQVESVRRAVEKLVNHPMNHVLIQLYRRGEDYISEHSDKSLDIVRGSSIVNVSFGAQRTMRLRTKKSRGISVEDADLERQTQRVPMPHGSVFVLGPETNMRWLHGIQPDKRPLLERSDSETAYNSERISLTFRHIGTFLDSTSGNIWGQGATSKSSETAQPVINADKAATADMIHAFGLENQSTEFDWPSVYGAGFDVLHFSGAPAPAVPLLFLSADYTVNLAVKICLEELSIPYQPFGVHPSEAGRNYSPTLSFHDTDASKTQVDGTIPVLFYIGRFYPVDDSRPITASTLPLLLEHTAWRMRVAEGSDTQRFLVSLAARLEKMPYLSGRRLGIVDCAYWPLVDEVLETMGEEAAEDDGFGSVLEWYQRLGERPSVRKAIWMDAEGEPMVTHNAF